LATKPDKKNMNKSKNNNSKRQGILIYTGIYKNYKVLSRQLFVRLQQIARA